jgi:hypothetical protein
MPHRKFTLHQSNSVPLMSKNLTVSTSYTTHTKKT